MTGAAGATRPHNVSVTRWHYAGIAFLVGLGAPVGALLLRALFLPSVRFEVWHDVQENAFFYAYVLAGTCCVFALAGYAAGVHVEKLKKAEEFYHYLADHDSLTGLFNSRAFVERYNRALERGAKLGQQVALVIADVDSLKEINDLYGHEAGSRALQHVADALRLSKRASDEAARWGGDEFTVLLEGGDQEAALRVAEMAIGFLRDNPLHVGKGEQVRIAVTMGVTAAVPSSPRDDLFATADRALYQAKREGGNRALALPHHPAPAAIPAE